MYRIGPMQTSPYYARRLPGGIDDLTANVRLAVAGRPLPNDMRGARSEAAFMALKPPGPAADSIVAVQDNMRYGQFNNIPLLIGLVDVVVLPQPQALAIRTFMMIQNTHATQNMFVRFGAISDATTGVLLAPADVFGLDVVVSQDEIHIIASGAATTGVLVYCNNKQG